MNEGGRDVRLPGGNGTKAVRLLLTAALAALSITLFEIIKTLLFHNITVWDSHIITISLFTFASVSIVGISMKKWSRLDPLTQLPKKDSSRGPRPASGRHSPPFALILAIVFIGSLTLMTDYETLKQTLWPDILIWESHAITIGFGTVITTLSSFFVLRTMRKMNTRILSAIDACRQSETSVREYMLFLRQLLDDIPIAIPYTDPKDIVVGCNSSFERFTGRCRDNIIGRHTDTVVTPSVWNGSDDTRNYAREHRDITIRETNYETDDGHTRDVFLYKAAYYNTAGELNGHIGAFIDVTERRSLEERLRVTEKLNAVGLLASGIAHDFNNNLTIILNSAYFLEPYLPPSEFETYKNNIIKTSEYSASLVQGLLDFARTGKRREDSVDVHTVILDVVSALKPLFGDRIAITQSLDAPEHNVAGEAAKIFNALFNLSLNARDAITGQGRLSITTKVTTVDRLAQTNKYPELQTGRYINVNVTDTGIGMGEETKKRIFEPFSQPKQRPGGRALAFPSPTAPSGTTTAPSTLVAASTRVRVSRYCCRLSRRRNGYKKIEPAAYR
jgi:PAS domain S-box-containing protein